MVISCLHNVKDSEYNVHITCRGSNKRKAKITLFTTPSEHDAKEVTLALKKAAEAVNGEQ